MGSEIHFNLARKSGRNGLEDEDDEISFWSLIYEKLQFSP
jgi:hypothetical protein